MVLAAAPASAWRAVDPHDTLYVNLPQGRVVIELAPQFAPRYVANIKQLARQGFSTGCPSFACRTTPSWNGAIPPAASR